MTPIRSQKKKPKSPPAKNSQKEEGRRKKLFAKFPKKIHAEENGISNRQKYPSFISPLTVGSSLKFWPNWRQRTNQGLAELVSDFAAE